MQQAVRHMRSWYSVGNIYGVWDGSPMGLEERMTLKELAPILTTADIDRSVRFYVDVLGFTCGMGRPEAFGASSKRT